MSFSPLYRALADETRYRLVVLLLGHDCCVSELARRLAISESAVSQQLKVLKGAGLLQSERRGYFMYYTIDREKLRELAHDLQRLASMERVAPTGASSSCICQKHGADCSAEVKFFCHGTSEAEGKTTLRMAPAERRRQEHVHCNTVCRHSRTADLVIQQGSAEDPAGAEEGMEGL